MATNPDEDSGSKAPSEHDIWICYSGASQCMTLLRERKYDYDSASKHSRTELAGGSIEIKGYGKPDTSFEFDSDEDMYCTPHNTECAPTFECHSVSLNKVAKRTDRSHKDEQELYPIDDRFAFPSNGKACTIKAYRKSF